MAAVDWVRGECRWRVRATLSFVVEAIETGAALAGHSEQCLMLLLGGGEGRVVRS